MGCAASVPGENKPGDAPKASQGEKAVDGFSKAAPKPVVVDGKPVPVSIATRPSQEHLNGSDELDRGHVLYNPRPMYDRSDYKFKSKIICTLGPVSRDVPVLEAMLRQGMKVARFNFSHGTHEYHQETLNNLRAACKNTGILCGVLLDTKGPEIRTGFLKDGAAVMLKQGSEVTLTTDYTVHGDSTTIAVSYPSLAKDVGPGSKILCADGSITLTVLSCDVEAGTLRARCENDAKLGERKNMNLPGVIVDLPTITAKDKEDLTEWGVKNKVDFVAASFVRKGADVDHIRSVLGDAAKSISIISKVENQEGLDNFADIVDKSDGVMVARGDLGMEIPMHQIFLAQKRMIKRCNEQGKPVVTATQMLESMTGAPRPTRAEATDVANAILDGTDCVMLSGETAAGEYPVEAVQVMSRICGEAEAHIDAESVFRRVLDRQVIPMPTLESLASTSVRAAHKVGARLIVSLARSGRTAHLIAKYRPSCPVLMVVVDETNDGSAESVARRALVYRGIIPMVVPSTGDYKTQLAQAVHHAKELGLVLPGDQVVGIHALGKDSVMKVINVTAEAR
mmetsp:Transcript_82/g.184  ORF Transcript_82/g.184 Transcript_82/m.184 type:complete len:566 (-) Transcript_82:92-1789(-)